MRNWAVLTERFKVFERFVMSIRHQPARKRTLTGQSKNKSFVFVFVFCFLTSRPSRRHPITSFPN
ncbi:hypothetical protein BCR44DRAFT_1429593 [Catenaria anguillulae PL171]|uniref:Uncharacterized protein n=1 Tax=Catenaria anguillulae PL171 TaxID=765915 RepID=A0A1Y2HWI5_9FUNG|nr:hypothetical protein BCR44DRAFT_1429593 [Catenaria anguillulae PL171]